MTDDAPEPEIMIVQTVLGHPEQLPAFDEIDYMLPDYSTATVRSQVGALVDKGALARVEHDAETFYGLTAEYRDELDHDGLTDAEHALQEATLQTEHTPAVAAKLRAERPEWPPANAMDGWDLQAPVVDRGGSE